MKTIDLLKRRSVRRGVLLLALPLGLLLPGCTDLGEDVFGVVTPAEFYQTEAEFLAATAPVYAQLRAMMWSYHNISQHTTDETMVPTRGTDWDDGGAWRALHQHTWDANLGIINGAWVDAYTGIARANVVLETLEASDVAGKETFVAELRTLRAFYYYQLMDLFGGVPIVTVSAVDPKNPPAPNSRAEVFAFIEQELKESVPNLVDKHDDGNYGRITKGAANALLASMYVNAEVFTGTASASGLQRGQARWQDAVDAADAVLNSGVYTLENNWFDNFAVDNHKSRENIFVVGHLAVGGLGMNFNMRQLHYNQIPQSPWNGFTTLAETYFAFDDEDERKKIFLVGQQYDANGNPISDRQGNPLVFTPDQPLIGAGEGHGVRILKWALDPNQVGGDSGNDYAFLRLSEMYLIKAEALNELRGPNQESIDLINTVRARVFSPEEPLQLADYPTKEALRERILQERLFELTMEAKRRQDLIRHGKYTTVLWEHKAQNQAHRVVLPIPQPQLDANPNLQQNPGY